MTSILFVCQANVCRSPAMAAALSHLAAKEGRRVTVDSCGVGWLNVGKRPDPRMFAAAKKRGIVLDHQAQQFQDHFFDAFDWIVAVNGDVAEQLKLRARSEADKKKVRLAGEFSKKYKDQEIPDPYYLDGDGFDKTMDQILDCCEGLLVQVVAKRGQ